MGLYLGIHDGHNSSAVLFENGNIRYAIQEERLTGEKNFFGYPLKSIQKILDETNLKISDIDELCIASLYEMSPRSPRSFKDAFDSRYESGFADIMKRSLFSTKAYHKMRTAQRMEERKKVYANFGFQESKISFYEHHQSHAASAYYGLKKDDAPYLVITLDGGGDSLSGTVWTAQNGEMKRLVNISHENSLGEIYAVTTHYLGFMPLEHEYKLMGMAPYASIDYAKKIAEVYHSYLGIDPENSLKLKRKIPEPLSLLGPRLAKDFFLERFDNICAGLQLFTEQIILTLIENCIKKTGIHRILAAGGVFMNVKANKVISENEQVEYFEAFPSCGDETLPFGSCYLAAANKNEETVYPIKHFYLGNDISVKECEEIFSNNPQYHVEKPGNMAKRVAELLADRKVVARASGPMEFGARALGNRSIIADPINQDVVRVINQMIKKRDFWMPFAPVVLREHANTYFVNPKHLPSPYMMNTFDSRDQRLDFMAAIHNADLTARPQILEQGQNTEYENILREFDKITGRKVLLNTSFNLHGYPIVSNAKEAIEVFAKSGLEYLQIGRFIVSKKPLRS